MFDAPRLRWIVLAPALAIGLADAAPGTPNAASGLSPPLEHDSMLTELGNAIRRHDVLARATPADAALVQTAFFAGSWDTFDTWAGLILAGKLPGTAPAPADTPHARYWAMVLGQPAVDRDALLRFLIPARRLHAGLLDKLGRPMLPVCNAGCERLLLAYVAAFPAPRHAADPKVPFGPTLIVRSHYPDELTVGVVADLGLAAAVPQLERWLGAQRRFHQLYTDYSTHPQEVGGLYFEALRGLVKLARGTPALAPDIRKALAAELARDTPPATQSFDSPEKVWFETESDGGGTPNFTGPRSAVGEQTVRGSITLPRGAVTMSKLPSLAQAAQAIAGDRAAIEALADRVPLHPEAKWLARIDLTWPLEGRGGTIWRDGRRLVALAGNRSVTALDTTTGDQLFTAELYGIDNAGGIQGYASAFAVAPAGLVMPTLVRAAKVAAPDQLVLCTLDPATGEIVRTAPVPGIDHPERTAEFIAAVSDGLWYQVGRIAQKIAWDGKLVDKRTLAERETLRVAGDKLVRFTIDKLVVEAPDGHVVVDRSFADIAGTKEQTIVEAVLPRKDDLLALSRNQTIYAIDYAGKLRWRADLDEPWRDHGAEPCDGDRICAHTGKDLYIFAPTGARIAKLPVPKGTRETAVAKGMIYFLTDAEVIVEPMAGGARHTLVKDLTGMSHLAGVTDDCVLVNFYSSPSSSYFLGCFSPRP